MNASNKNMYNTNACNTNAYKTHAYITFHFTQLHKIEHINYKITMDKVQWLEYYALNEGIMQ